MTGQPPRQLEQLHPRARGWGSLAAGVSAGPREPEGPNGRSPRRGCGPGAHWGGWRAPGPSTEHRGSRANSYQLLNTD